MPPSKKYRYDWDAEVRAKKHRQPSVGKGRARFEEEPTTLAWLDKFASKRSSEGGRGAFRRLEDVFPWLWNPEWDDIVNIDKAGVKQLKDAVRQAEAMENSLDIFLFCVKDRLGRLRSSLKHVASRSYFPLLSDDVLAIIFEFASMPFSQVTGNEYDIKTPSRISQVSRRFRNVTLRLPHFWRYLDVKSDVKLMAARSAVAGPILEAYAKSKTIMEREKRVDELYSFVGRIATQSSRISVLRFDLSPRLEDNFFKKLHDVGEFASLFFPSLIELVLNFEDARSECRTIHFYRCWDMPALRVLKAHNVIPKFRSKTAYDGIAECSLTLDEVHRDEWKFSKVFKFLSLLSSVTMLDLLLHADVMIRYCDATEITSLPKVAHLRTAFPGMDISTVRGFCRALRTPNKKKWNLEIKPGDYNMLDSILGRTLGDLFGERSTTGVNMPNSNLKVVDIVFYCEFGQINCKSLTNVFNMAPNLENLSVTYVVASEQLRRFEFKNCKGKVENMVGYLGERFDERLGVENPHFVLEGFEAEADEQGSPTG